MFEFGIGTFYINIYNERFKKKIISSIFKLYAPYRSRVRDATKIKCPFQQLVMLPSSKKNQRRQKAHQVATMYRVDRLKNFFDANPWQMHGPRQESRIHRRHGEGNTFRVDPMNAYIHNTKHYSIHNARPNIICVGRCMQCVGLAREIPSAVLKYT